jgi:hypothetical protein
VAGYLPRFSLAIKLRCFLPSLVALSATEASSVPLAARVAPWEAWEAREPMLTSMSCAGARTSDPDVVPATRTEDDGFHTHLNILQR